MLTYERLFAWLQATGWGHLDQRIVDGGWAFFVSTQPDAYHAGNQGAMTYGNGPMIVLKSDGKMFQYGSNPVVFPIYDATSEKDFYQAVRQAGFGKAKPYGQVPLG